MKDFGKWTDCPSSTGQAEQKELERSKGIWQKRWQCCCRPWAESCSYNFFKNWGSLKEEWITTFCPSLTATLPTICYCAFTSQKNKIAATTIILGRGKPKPLKDEGTFPSIISNKEGEEVVLCPLSTFRASQKRSFVQVKFRRNTTESPVRSESFCKVPFMLILYIANFTLKLFVLYWKQN